MRFRECIHEAIGYAIFFLCYRRVLIVVAFFAGFGMSKWADIWSKYANEVHTVPLDPKKMPCEELATAAFGHVPFIDCHCKPRVTFGPEGEYLVVSHNDVERGGCGNNLETYQ